MVSSWVAVGFGAVLLVGVGATTPGLFALARRHAWQVSTVLGLFVVGACTGPCDGIYNTEANYVPSNPPYNGYKVFLSSPRHADSGSRGECGWEENVNGRKWNEAAASADGYAKGLMKRGYRVQVSRNTRDNGYTANWQLANNFGSNVTIVTHTNAATPCPASPSYTYIATKTGNANSHALRDTMLADVAPNLPHVTSPLTVDRDLDELKYGVAAYRVYMEIFFHTNQAAVNWFQANNGLNIWNQAWQYGWAVDDCLGYPR